MDVCDESDDTQSNNDDEIIDTSDDDSLTTQEISRDQTFSTAATFGTSESNNSSPNYPAPYPNPVNLTIYPPMNGLNINPVFYTDTQSSAHIADDRNVANYEEVSTHPYSYPPPPISISLFSEIQRPPVPTHDGLQYPPPSSVTPLSTYPVNDNMPPPFIAPVLPIPSPDTTNNNPPEPQQTITATQEALNGEPVQNVKKRGRKRLSDNATRGKEAANIMSEDSIPKKRGRKRKDSNDGVGGKTNDASQGNSHQSINDANLENSKTNVDEAQKQNSEISIQSLNAITDVKNIDEIKEEKKKKKRSRKKTEIKSNETINVASEDTKRHSLTTGKPSATKKQSIEELLSNQKNRMAFPKGTFLIRYSDLETLESDQVWCVDNHHMLLKYRLSSHIEGQRRLYLKSQPERFIGWKCEEPWHFYELTVLERDRDGSKVLILYPDAKQLAECREKAKRQKQIAEEIKRGLGTSYNSGGIKQGPDETGENPIIQKDSNLMDIEDERLQQQENIEVQMVDEAANAIERFILIPDNDYTETDDENMTETVFVENPTEEHMIITEEDNK